MTEPKQHAFVIKRHEWTSGKYRRSETGQFCAIGAYERSLGIPRQDIGGLLHRKYAQKLVERGAAWLVCPQGNGELYVSKLAADIIAENDRDKILHARKERELIRLFAKHNVTLTFED